MEKQPPIKIVIPVEEELPYVPEPARSRPAERALGLGRRVSRAAGRGVQAAWRSRIRRKATGKVRQGTGALITRGSGLLREKLVKRAASRTRDSALTLRSRIRATDWKWEAKAGSARSLRWASRQLATISDRFTPVDEDTADSRGEPTDQ